MPYLLAVSLIWAFSFGLIKGQLAGLEPSGVAAVRLLLSCVFFLPLVRLREVPRELRPRLAGLGAVQYGAMYLLYIHAYRYLQAHEVALFTIFTPLWVIALADLLQRRFRPRFWATALLAVAGTAVVVQPRLERADVLWGLLLLQLSNACFAYGQLRYKLLREQHPHLSDVRCFGLLYAGALAIALPAALLSWDGSLLSMSATQAGSLAYLGVLASGLCFFWWNVGATRVDAGTLAAANDLKVPAAVAVSLLVFGESADVPRLLLGGGAVLGALVLNRQRPSAPAERLEAEV
jgi:drug/metabolite transporter (DMT)-like permease